MWEYDYKIFKFKMHSEVIEMLNDAGNDNWEIVNYDEENPSKFGDRFVAKILLKRIKKISAWEQQGRQ